jgi:recombinational DNA repair ATPase RecF
VIRIESITIKEFRGIRDLTLDFKGTNFAICGPNGTGKSGVVDAIEFALTGNVSRLSGEGRGDISLKQHGPHVDMRNEPNKAFVNVQVAIPSLKKTVTIERNLKTPGAAKVTPSDSTVLEILEHVKARPEIVLSRRELIRYVLATPGKRAEEVQALLHLDQVEKVRSGLQKIANARERQFTSLTTAATQARDNLLRALDTTTLTSANVIAATNVRRAILGLTMLAELTQTTSLKDGMETPGPVKPQRIPKAQALADIRAAREALDDITSAATTTLVAQVTADLTALSNDPAVAAGVEREKFFTTGLGLIEIGMCPLCDTPWDLDQLKNHIQVKIDHLKEVSLKRQVVETKTAPLIKTLRAVQASINILGRHAALAAPVLRMDAAVSYSATCGSTAEKLTAFLPLAESIAVLATMPIVPPTVLNDIEELSKVVVSLPEPTKQDAAREWLTVAQERLDVWREAMRKQNAAKDQAHKIRQISNIYTATSDSVLERIYKEVQTDFATLYGKMHGDDEEDFKATLVPSMGKLGFDVDFYGRGLFPPGAYHSEGHQDSMGLCLYLALMRHLQGAGFTLAVLDDVLMSVDSGHRRQACALLKREFPNTQFIMTTHDPIWRRHMRTEGLLVGRSSVDFRTWCVDLGPTRWDDRDIWTEINDYLLVDNVRAAAGLLRHYLEYVSTELCHRLRAPVEFRGDAQYQLGELMPAAIARMRKLYKNGKVAANSWDQKEIVERVDDRESAFALLVQASNAEQWQVNTAVHYNNWDNLTKEDFSPVAEAFKNLLDGFACSDCCEYLRVSPDRETPEMIRCECGKTSINLRRKST